MADSLVKVDDSNPSFSSASLLDLLTALSFDIDVFKSSCLVATFFQFFPLENYFCYHHLYSNIVIFFSIIHFIDVIQIFCERIVVHHIVELDFFILTVYYFFFVAFCSFTIFYNPVSFKTTGAPTCSFPPFLSTSPTTAA